MNFRFFALLSRMRFIARWSLMRNSLSENVQEHSHTVAVIAHALATIGRAKFDKAIDPNVVATAALFHDASEIFTGDLPTPVKYLNTDLQTAYQQVEDLANQKLVSLLPEFLRESYLPLLTDVPEDVRVYIKAADRLAAYIKCLEELRAGNDEFKTAKKEILHSITKNAMPETQYFLDHFVPAFHLNLDELNLS